MRIEMLAAGLLLAHGLAPGATAQAQQRLAEPAVEVRVVAQLPVAVTRALAVGVPEPELMSLVRELRRGQVPAGDVIEIIRFAPLATDLRFPDRGDVRGTDRLSARGADGVRLSERVRFLLDRGVRGRELASEIHRELRAQGIPAGPPSARSGPPPIARGFIPAEARRRMLETDEPGAAERRGPPADVPARPGGPPADRPGGPPADRPGGPPAGAGQQRPVTPADTGQRRGPPDEAGQRRGPPDEAAQRRAPTPDRRPS